MLNIDGLMHFVRRAVELGQQDKVKAVYCIMIPEDGGVDEIAYVHRLEDAWALRGLVAFRMQRLHDQLHDHIPEGTDHTQDLDNILKGKNT